MSCIRSITFTIPGKKSPGVQITAIENGDGTLEFTVDVRNTSTLTADLRGLFFDLTGDAKSAGKLDGLAWTSSAPAGTISDFDTVGVIDLGQGANMIGAASPFDVGLEFGDEGIGKGKKDINGPVTFTLSNEDGNLTLDDIANTEFGARLTSVGAPDGKRLDSAKLTTIAPAAPDAREDSYDIFEDGQDGLDDPSSTPEGVKFEVLENDTDADGNKLRITGFDEDHLPLHGTVTIVDGDDADLLPGDAVLYTPDEDYSGPDSFTYCITDDNGGTDFAEVDVNIEAVADVPDLDVQVTAGSAANKILVTVTATETDFDSSEFIDRIELGGIPANVTVTPLGTNPLGEPNVLQQVFELTVPDDGDTNFVLGITAVAKETSNGDEEKATDSVIIAINHTLNLLDASFTAENQNIWEPGGQITFEDDRFLGINTAWNERDEVEIIPLVADLYGATNGSLKAGFQSTLTFEGGEIDAQVDYDLEIETLYNKTTDVLFLTADAVLSNASFTTEGPEGSYNLDFLFHFDAHVEAGVDAGILGTATIINKNFGPWDATQNILNLDSDDLSFTVGLPAGFSLTFAWPNVDTTSDPLAGNTASSDGASNNFLELGLDVDALVFTLLKLPNPFDIAIPDDVPFVDGSIELADLDLSFGLNFLQDFLLTVNSLEGTITFEDNFSQAFDFDTDITLTNASSHDFNNDGSIGYMLELTPDVDLLNDTELGFNFGVQFDVLKISGSYDIGVYSGPFEVGPVVSVGTTVPLGSVDIYNNEFALNFGSGQTTMLYA